MVSFKSFNKTKPESSPCTELSKIPSELTPKYTNYVDYVGHKGFFSLKNHTPRRNPLWNSCTLVKARPAEDMCVWDTIFQGDVGRDLNEPLHLQSRIVNASLGKTRRISTSNERHTSIANKPYNLCANIDNFTRERNKPEITLEVDSDQGYKSPISRGFVKHLFDAPACVQQAGITSDKIKLKYTDISTPICFHCLLSFPCWAPSPQTPPTPWPTTPGLGTQQGCPSGCLFCGTLATFWGQLPWHRTEGSCDLDCTASCMQLPPSTLLLRTELKRSGRGSWRVRKCRGSVKLHGKCERTGTTLLENRS